MKTITFKDLESEITYCNYTAFVYDDGTQIMYSGGEITEESVLPFLENDGKIEIGNMSELPEIKKIMQENLLAEFEPASNTADDGYDMMVDDFAKDKGKIAFVENEGTKVYMLVW